MSCSKCNRNTCNCITSQQPINCDPCTKSTYCAEKIDTDCVYYHLCKPSDPSKLTCLGLPSNTSLTLILEEIDKMLCGFIGTFGIIAQDTNTVDTTVTSALNIYTIKSDVRIDPASTLPYSIGPNGIKLDCCVNDCSDVVKEIDYIFNNIDKGADFFSTLQPTYFTKSDLLLSLELVDNSSIVGDSLSYLKYTLMPSGIDIITTLGDNVSLGINNCGRNIIGGVYPLVIEMQTVMGCFDFKICSVNIERVLYSERYNFAYRFNPQINNLPIIADENTSPVIDKGIVYINDVKTNSLSTSFGGVLRKFNLNTKELTTISGTVSASPSVVTISGLSGDVVGYDFLSGPVLDKNEISNGEPAIYVALFGPSGRSAICRVIKEKNNECDERANWTTYVIAGDTTVASGDIPSVAGTSSFGNAARFAQLYGMKKWYDVNGEPSFLVVDAGNSKIKLLYYNGSGSKNSATNWKVYYFGLNIVSGVDRNINVDYVDSSIDPDPSLGQKIIIFTSGQINFYEFTVPTPSLTDLTTLANYVLTDTIGDGTSTDIDGSVPAVARVSEPNYLSRYMDFSSSDAYYMWGNAGPGLPTPSTVRSRLRNVPIVGLNNVSSLIGGNTFDFGTTGLLSSTVSGYSHGFFTDLQGNLYDLTMGGIRLWDLSTVPYSCSLYSGGFDALSTQTQWSGFNQTYMDTQYEFKIDC
jgi:hypothetical protein